MSHTSAPVSCRVITPGDDESWSYWRDRAPKAASAPFITCRTFFGGGGVEASDRRIVLSPDLRRTAQPARPMTTPAATVLAILCFVGMFLPSFGSVMYRRQRSRRSWRARLLSSECQRDFFRIFEELLTKIRKCERACRPYSLLSSLISGNVSGCHNVRIGVAFVPSPTPHATSNKIPLPSPP